MCLQGNMKGQFVTTHKSIHKSFLVMNVITRQHKREIYWHTSNHNHAGVKFPCDKCTFRAAWKRELFTHIKSIHEGVKFPCNKCDYKATRKGSLITHMKSIHAGVKFPCNKCDYKATWKGTLLKHKKSIHPSMWDRIDQYRKLY